MEIAEARQEWIGLALSGGGFRAALFHLGVIRRLEELQIMQDVDVISCVSGGSILAAFYACEMEDQLRQKEPAEWRNPAVRMAAHKEVARKFLRAVDLNMRSRALVFTPFYHPILFLKALLTRPFRADARSVLIQKEFDKHFYRSNAMDQLPCVAPGTARATEGGGLTGPKLLINTTSLMTGERKAFSRDANSRLAELKTSNKNVLKLSQIVGASSGVPLVFPPTSVCGELLVDGGVSDNQGIEGLLEEVSRPCAMRDSKTEKEETHPCDDPDRPREQPPDSGGDGRMHFLLISDASGQLELNHRQATSSIPVLLRVNDILQHQVRNKLLELVERAYHDRKICFAFVHLLLNLKDAGVKRCVPSEYLQNIARIRTDLDQFSYIEREALMYHGYTLIDAMVCRWCSRLIRNRFGSIDHRPPLRTAPLFAWTHDGADRGTIVAELTAGSQSLFLARCWKKYRWQTAAVGIPGALVVLAIIVLLLAFPQVLFTPVRESIQRYLIEPLPLNLLDTLNAAARKVQAPPLAAAASAIRQFVEAVALRASELGSLLVVLALPLYVVAFLVWATMRRIALRLDQRSYRKFTGGYEEADDLEWREADSEGGPKTSAPKPA